MTLSCNRVLKAGAVKLDTENKIIIDTAYQHPLQHLSDGQDDDESVARKKEIQAQSMAIKIIQQAERQAEDILSNARISAVQEQAAIRKSAESEATRIKADAQELGYKTGMDAATSEGNGIKAEANSILETAKAERAALEESLEPDMVGLILGIMEKLVGDTIALNPAIIVNLIKQGLASTAITGNIVIYVSPQDLEHVQAHKDELLALTDGSVNVEIVKDLSLNPHDCIIHTPFGDIDCSLDQQYEALRANITYILNNK